VGHRVHLERALRLGDRLGGHLVQGHVDGVGVVRRLDPHPGWTGITIDAPPELSRYIVAKGSICVDGLSLTVNELSGPCFSVGIIPHTISVTRIGNLRPSDRVNLEVDLLAKYVERLLGGRSGGLDLEKLREHGFA
jgi:riboflavin synthase